MLFPILLCWLWPWVFFLTRACIIFTKGSRRFKSKWIRSSSISKLLPGVQTKIFFVSFQFAVKILYYRSVKRLLNWNLISVFLLSMSCLLHSFLDVFTTHFSERCNTSLSSINVNLPLTTWALTGNLYIFLIQPYVCAKLFKTITYTIYIVGRRNVAR